MNSPATPPSQQLAEALDAEIDSQRIAEVLSEALTATIRTRAGTVEPCWKTRVGAASLILSYKVGRPVERQQIISQTLAADPIADIEDRLAKSPSLRRSLAAALAKIEGEDRQPLIET